MRKLIIIVILTISLWQHEISPCSSSCQESYAVVDEIIQVTFTCGETSRLSISDNMSALLVEFNNCIEVPAGLFINSSSSLQTLVLSAPISLSPSIRSFAGKTLDGLNNLTELHLVGFDFVNVVDPLSLSSLSHIECLYLDGFGGEYISISTLGKFLQGLGNTPTQGIFLNKIRSAYNTVNPLLNFTSVFAIPNVTITSLAIDDSVISSLTGRLSQVLPDLTYFSISLSAYSGLDIDTILDLVLIETKFEIVHIYGYLGVAILNYGGQIYRDYPTDQDIVDVQHLYPNSSCFWGYRFVFFPRAKSVSINFVSAFPINTPIDLPICFYDNVIEYFDHTNSLFPSKLPLFTGLRAVKWLILQNTSITEFHPLLISELPQLETLVLAQNNLQNWIATDDSAVIFLNGLKIASLDLSYCQLTYIPYLEFSPLISLKYLNLSYNKIVNADWLMENCTKLAVLNLSNNAIEQLSTNFRTQLNSQIGTGTHPLEIDLSKNQLSCLCNATEFIAYMQTQTTLNFTGLDAYQCLYLDGTWPFLMHVDIDKLNDECSSLEGLKNNSACPCEITTQKVYYRIRYTLAEYNCQATDGTYVSLKYYNPNTTKCVDYRTTAWFIGTVVGGSSFVIIVAIVVGFIIFLRYYRPLQYKQMIDCLGINRIVELTMRIQWHRAEPTDMQRNFPHDAYVLFHPDHKQTVEDEILSRLTNLGVKLKRDDEMSFGSMEQDVVQESMETCRRVILILTPEFVLDRWFKQVTICSQLRLRAIVPIVYKALQQDHTDVCFVNIRKTCVPIYWSEQAEEQERIVREIYNRLKGNIAEELTDRLESNKQRTTTDSLIVEAQMLY